MPELICVSLGLTGMGRREARGLTLRVFLGTCLEGSGRDVHMQCIPTPFSVSPQEANDQLRARVPLLTLTDHKPGSPLTRTALDPDPDARLHYDFGLSCMTSWVAAPSIQGHVLGTLKTGLSSLSVSSDFLVLP
jgi:hypothetical protein